MQHNQSLQKTKYVLMVEDTASVAALYRSYLTPLDIDINIVGTGRDAIESIGRREPDLILLDLRLPDTFARYDGDGRTLCSEREITGCAYRVYDRPWFD